jgi:hypothetical protein
MCDKQKINPNTKYLVKEVVDSAYKFKVIEDLGNDAQGGHWYRTKIHCTVKEVAENLAKQLNNTGELYLPGNIYA